MQLTLSVKCTYHHKNASYFVNFTENHTKSTLSSSLHIFLVGISVKGAIIDLPSDCM